MKRNKLLTLGVFGLFLTIGGQAAAQPVRIDTAQYSERSVEGDQVVTFTGDELAGMTGGPYGDLVRRPPGPVRVGLIRPRMNFVSALLKSVENL